MPCIDPFSIRPTERSCVCPQLAPGEGHSPKCNAAFKAKLVGAKDELREVHALLQLDVYN